MQKLFLLVTIFAFLGTSLLIITPANAARRSYGSYSFKTPRVSTYRVPIYKAPSIRTYSNGGQLYMQRGYVKKNGTYVQPHLKTKPDNNLYNNRKNILGY